MRLTPAHIKDEIRSRQQTDPTLTAIYKADGRVGLVTMHAEGMQHNWKDEDVEYTYNPTDEPA